VSVAEVCRRYMAAEWFTAIGTLALAVLAVFQDTVRGWFYHPALDASIQTQPPDCIAVPITTLDNRKIADSIYLRIWVKNIGNRVARNVEVYANNLLQKRTDGAWERVHEFPPMNLRWSNVHSITLTTLFPAWESTAISVTSPTLRPEATRPWLGNKTQDSTSPIKKPH